MNAQAKEKPDYGNWVSKRLICMLAGMIIVLLGLSLISHLFIIMATLLFAPFVYFAYAYYKFSPRGGNIQVKIRNLVLDCIDWDGWGTAIDIGCGNGALAIELAKRYPKAYVTGIDSWIGIWDYSREGCERNAEIECVTDRLIFQKASATALPFEDDSFDLAISNFVFHAVRDAKDKRDVIKEALRVVKKGGKFAFQDLFPVKKLYGEVDDLLETIKGWGIRSVSYVNTSNSDSIPRPLKLPFMVGAIGIIYGTK